jgi:hypothetical protein
MKKRAGIARAMMLEPDLLFFDEPSAGLDPISAVELDHLIATLSRDLGITIVIVTHELPSIFLVPTTASSRQGGEHRGESVPSPQDESASVHAQLLRGPAGRPRPRKVSVAVEKLARLGLFLVIAIVVVLATGLLFIQRMRSREVIELVTYTQENVAGLDISSPVRYRGVAVGRVSNLQVEPGGRTIEIDFELFTDRLTSVGANVTNLQELARAGVLERLRAQVVGNPVTGEAYLFLDMPENPPPPMTLGFTPSRPYIPSMPTPIAELRDRLPEVLERAEATLQVLKEIITKMPDTLDRSNQFFTNVERIIRESELPALSADSRRFFTTTSSQIDEIASNLEGLVGENGTLVRFTEEARAAIKDADLPASGRATRDAMDQATPGGRGPAAFAAGDARVARAAPRGRAAATTTAGVGGLRPCPRSEAEMTPRSRSGLVVLLAAAALGVGCRLQLQRPRPFRAHDRATAGRAVRRGRRCAERRERPPARDANAGDTSAVGCFISSPMVSDRGSVWLWTTTPDRYLDRPCGPPLRRAASASSTSAAPSLAVTLVAWQLEGGASPRLVGAVEIQVTTTDRAIHWEVVRAEEPIAADLPGDLAAAAGRLLGRLATECLSRVMRQGS